MRIDDDMIREFRRFETTLHEQFPDTRAYAAAELEKLADPLTASPDACWEELWDKPLYTRSSIAAAETRIARIRPFTPSGWRSWGEPGSDFHIEHDPKNGKPNARSAFTSKGRLSSAIHEQTRIPLFRLYRIQRAAIVLRELSRDSATPFARFQGRVDEAVILELRSMLQFGWGPTTIVHALTDFGLAVKTDMHLVNTARWLGLTDMPLRRAVPSLREAVAIIRAVRALTQAVFGTAAPQHLRYVDVTLMQISKFDIIPRPCAFEGFRQEA